MNTALNQAWRVIVGVHREQAASGHRKRAPAPTVILITRRSRMHPPKPVGASLLAMVVNDDAPSLVQRGVLTSFASKLAPTVVYLARTCWHRYR